MFNYQPISIDRSREALIIEHRHRWQAACQAALISFDCRSPRGWSQNTRKRKDESDDGLVTLTDEEIDSSSIQARSFSGRLLAKISLSSCRSFGLTISRLEWKIYRFVNWVICSEKWLVLNQPEDELALKISSRFH